MRERFAKKREPVWCDWAEGGERGSEKGDGGYGWTQIEKKRSSWPVVLTDMEGKKGCSDLTWCGETSVLHVQPLSTGVHSWLLLVLSVSHAQQTQLVLSHNAKRWIHTYVQTNAHRNTQSSHQFSATGHIFVTHSLLKRLFVSEKCQTSWNLHV